LRLPAGSTVWLLAHDLRLDWRRRTSVTGARRWLALIITVGAPLFLAGVIGVPLALALNHFGPPRGWTAQLVAAAALASAFTFMLSQALAEVVDALYERGDLDLLFSSPIPPRRVITVRALGIAFAAFSVFGFFSLGPLAAMAVMGHPRWLAILPVLYACALAATGVALALGALLIGWVGPRRTRFIGRALSVGFGSVFFLGTQVLALASGQISRGPAVLRLSRLAAASAPRRIEIVLRAFQGEPRAFALVVGALLAVFALATAWFGPRFAAFHAAAKSAPAAGAARAGPPRPFRRGLPAAVLAKELRLLLRDPMLLPQVILRVVYLVPAGIVAVQYGARLDFTALSGAVLAMTLMANQLAGSLAWMTISAEDAPDLLASSPAPRPVLLRIKLAAAVGTVMAIVALVAAPLALVAPYQGAVVLTGCAAAAVSAGLVNLWWQRPGKRSAFRERAPAPWFVNLAELTLGLLIALAAGLASAHHLAAVAPAAAALLVLLALRLPARP